MLSGWLNFMRSWAPTTVRRRRSKREVEDRSLRRDAFGPHPSAVATHDSHDDGQPESASRKFCPGMEPLEGLENYLAVGVVEADPIVSHMVDRDIPVGFGDANLDPSVIARSGELPCILEQLGQENPQEWHVPIGRDFRLHLEPHVAVRSLCTQIVHDLLPQRGQVDFRPIDLGPGHLTEVTDVVDDTHHVPACGPNTLQVVCVFSSERLA